MGTVREPSRAGPTDGQDFHCRSAGRVSGSMLTGPGPASELGRRASRWKHVRSLLREATSPAEAEAPTGECFCTRTLACRKSSSGEARRTVVAPEAARIDGENAASRKRSQNTGCQPGRSRIQGLMVRTSETSGSLQGQKLAARDAVESRTPGRNPDRSDSVPHGDSQPARSSPSVTTVRKSATCRRADHNVASKWGSRQRTLSKT